MGPQKSILNYCRERLLEGGKSVFDDTSYAKPMRKKNPPLNGYAKPMRRAFFYEMQCFKGKPMRHPGKTHPAIQFSLTTIILNTNLNILPICNLNILPVGNYKQSKACLCET